MSAPKRVFITGGSSGLGEGLARHYAAPGAVIGLVARRAELLATLAAELTARGATVVVCAGDVRDTAFMAKSAADFIAAAGGVDLVIANAGVGLADTVRTGDASGVAWLMEVNVIGVTNTVLPFVPTMLAQRSGVLCAVSSFAGHRAIPGRSAYSASKAAVIMFMDGLRMDLHDTGVHAMTLCPGYVHTPMTAEHTGMIFPISTGAAVDAMAGAIAAHKGTWTFPWQMRLLRHLVVRVPEAVMRKLAPPPRKSSSQ
jgi:NADP-dependent 3-hydroxy acid dehydrogenase YdfG